MIINTIVFGMLLGIAGCSYIEDYKSCVIFSLAMAIIYVPFVKWK